MAASVYNLVFRTDVVIELTENVEAWPTRGSEIATIDSSPGTVQDIQHFSIPYDPHTYTGSDNDMYKSNTGTVYYHVNSSALIAASPVFRDLLVGHNVIQTKGARFCVSARCLNARALLYILAIFHNRLDKIPDDMNIYRLAHLAVVVDALKCQESTLPISTAWCNSVKDPRCLRSPKPSEDFSGEYLLWLWVTYVFRRSEFKKVTEIILRRAGDKPFPTIPGLPIGGIIAAIQKRRLEVLEDATSYLLDYYRYLRSSSYECPTKKAYSSECGSVMAQALSENVAKLGIGDDGGCMSYPKEISIQKLCSGVIRFQEPDWSALDHQHGCSFREVKNKFMFHTSYLELEDVSSAKHTNHTKSQVMGVDLPLRLRSPPKHASQTESQVVGMDLPLRLRPPTTP